MKKLLLVFCFALLGACSPFYVLRAAYEQGKLLAARQNIDELLLDPQTSAAEHSKLSLVLQARDFAESMGLQPRGSFKKYVRLERNELAWVLVASKRDSFSLFTWWFPIVGSVPYKGYFEKGSAERAAKNLEELDYETFLRPTAAISTLGWFDDPVVSPTLQSPEHNLVNLVIHESLHSTLWIPGQVDFNESLANFVGLQGAVDFFSRQLAQCKHEADCTIAKQRLENATNSRESELRFSAIIQQLYIELETLYSSAASRPEKLAKRVEIFDKHIAPLRAKNPNMKALQSINNAEIIQLKLYMTKLDLFNRHFVDLQNSWPKFLASMRSIAEQMESDDSLNAWDLLQ